MRGPVSVTGLKVPPRCDRGPVVTWPLTAGVLGRATHILMRSHQLTGLSS